MLKYGYNKIEIMGEMNTERITIYENNTKLIEALKLGELISIYIEQLKRETMNYSFSVDSSNFLDEYYSLIY